MAATLPDIRARAAAIQALALDVDGTLTDGHIYIGPQGEAMKAFSVRDGFGLTLLREAGLRLAIITARRSAIVEHRAAELGITNSESSLTMPPSSVVDVVTEFMNQFPREPDIPSKTRIQQTRHRRFEHIQFAAQHSHVCRSFDS